MHIYFIGIGGAGIGPLALICSEAGYEVSGSDHKASEYTRYLEKKGVSLWIDQSGEAIKQRHAQKPIDWVISVSSITRLNPDHPELVFARKNGIKITERDAGLNQILKAKKLKMIAAAGTHGKTTTTAMLVWCFKQLNFPISYSVGAKMSYADMGHYEPGSEFFIYECDEFHRNFLNYYPALSIISSVTWDHHEVYPTREDYKQAFRDFVGQSKKTIVYDRDQSYLNLKNADTLTLELVDNPEISDIELNGRYNRQNAWLVARAVHEVTGHSIPSIINILNKYPGSQRRMEEISENLFSDYAHTPEEVVGCLSIASELASKRGKHLVAVYEPLTNRRQHYLKDEYKDCFEPTKKVYWLPSYLSREDPNLPILSPRELIDCLDDPSIGQPSELNDALWQNINEHVASGAMVICMTGGGGKSLDDWLRSKAQAPNQ
jgi:UDP-N-acetylmuramate--alanine ligase